MSFHLFPFLSDTTAPTVEGLPAAPSPAPSAAGSSTAAFKNLLARFSGPTHTAPTTDLPLPSQERTDVENTGLAHGVVTLERASFLTLVPTPEAPLPTTENQAEQPVSIPAPVLEELPRDARQTQTVSLETPVFVDGEQASAETTLTDAEPAQETEAPTPQEMKAGEPKTSKTLSPQAPVPPPSEDLPLQASPPPTNKHTGEQQTQTTTAPAAANELPASAQQPAPSAAPPLPNDAPPPGAPPPVEAQPVQPTPATPAPTNPEVDRAPAAAPTPAPTPTVLTPTEDTVQTTTPLVKEVETLAPTHTTDHVDGGGPHVMPEETPPQEPTAAPSRPLRQTTPKARTVPLRSFAAPADPAIPTDTLKPVTEEQLQGVEVKQVQVQPQQTDETAAWSTLAEQRPRPLSVSMTSTATEETTADPVDLATSQQQQGTFQEGDAEAQQDADHHPQEQTIRLPETPEAFAVAPKTETPDTTGIPSIDMAGEEILAPEDITEQIVQEEEAVLKPLEHALRDILSRNTSQAAPVFTQNKSAAAWMRTFLKTPMLPYEQQDGWQMMEVKLEETNSTMTVKTKRDQDGLAVSVVFSDPNLRAQVAEQAERIRESLKEEYDTPIDLSFSNEEEGTPESEEQATPTGATASQQLTASGEHEAPESPGALRRAGARHIWIG